jgi:hypothetical protein
VEALDVTDTDIDSFLNVGGELHEFSGEWCVDDGGGERYGLLELVGVLEDSCVTTVNDILDDRLDQGHDGLVGLLGGTLEVVRDNLGSGRGGDDTLHLNARFAVLNWSRGGSRSGSRLRLGLSKASLLSPRSLGVTLSPLNLQALQVKVALNVFQADTGSSALGQSEVKEIGGLESNLLLGSGTAQLISLLHDLGTNELGIIEQTCGVRAGGSIGLARIQSLLKARQTGRCAEAGLGTEVAEAYHSISIQMLISVGVVHTTANLLDNKDQAVGIAIKADADQLLDVTTRLALVP